MEQGDCLDSTLAPDRQRRAFSQPTAGGIDEAVSALLTRSDSVAASPADGEGARLATEFTAANIAWLDAVKASRLPAARYHRHLRNAKRWGGPTLADAVAAEALPGVRSAFYAEEDAYTAVSNLALEIHARPVQSLDDLALTACATRVLVWPTGRYAADGQLGTDEDVDKAATRALIESCLRFCEQNTSSPEGANAVSGDPDLQAAITRHRAANHALEAAAVAADPVRIRNEGGDTSVEAMAPLKEAENAADAAATEAWRAIFDARPKTVVGLLCLLRHAAENYEFEQGIDNPPDVFGALIGAVEALRFAMLPRPAEHDLSRLSILDLEHLARIASREREALLAVESQGFCWTGNKQAYSPLGEIIEAEGERMAFLGDYAVHEIALRRPTSKTDTNLRLEALVRHHLNCNGYIEPELMAEVVRTWGRA